MLRKNIAPKATACAAVLAAALWILPAFAQTFSYDPSPSAAAGGLAAGTGQEPEGMTVPFKHDAHNAKAKLKDCTACHHPLRGATGKSAKTATQRRCSDCHKPRPKGDDLAPALMVVSHKVCQDCHRAKGSGPVNCDGCHKKS